MIDVQTGAVTFDRPGVSIGPGLTRAQFGASALADGAKVLVANEPWHTWTLAGCYTSELDFLVTLYFHGEELASISLVHDDACYGASWGSWSEENERARTVRHDAWVARNAGQRRSFAWGALTAEFDPRSGCSAIVIRFGPASSITAH